jgi:hypothetical protein
MFRVRNVKKKAACEVKRAKSTFKVSHEIILFVSDDFRLSKDNSIRKISIRKILCTRYLIFYCNFMFRSGFFFSPARVLLPESQAKEHLPLIAQRIVVTQ